MLVDAVADGKEARTIDCTSGLLQSVVLPLMELVLVPGFIVSLMLLTMKSDVEGGEMMIQSSLTSPQSFCGGLQLSKHMPVDLLSVLDV